MLVKGVPVMINLWEINFSSFSGAKEDTFSLHGYFCVSLSEGVKQYCDEDKLFYRKLICATDSKETASKT